MARWLFPMLLSLVAATPALAQEDGPYTRVREEGAPGPQATLDDVAWLQGLWIGEGIGGAPALENWLPPTGTTMVGSFVQQEADGAIMFTEHMYLMEQDGSLVVKLKHFNADLTGWEDAEGMVTFPLVAVEPCAVHFNSLTYRCEPDGGLLVAVRMKSDGPDVEELVFRFRRPAGTEQPGHCAAAMTTMDMNECYAQVLERAEARQAQYVAAALEKHAGAAEVAAGIRQSEEAFAAYRDAECANVFQKFIDGTIRGVMALGCRINLTDRRTHTVWSNWLTYMDSTPPILPEPGPTP